MKEQKKLELFVMTGFGRMPIKDFLTTAAVDAGYGSYREAWGEGFRYFGYEDVSPDDLLD